MQPKFCKVYPTLLGGRGTTDEIVRWLKNEDRFSYVNSRITTENFPFPARKEQEEENIVVYDPECSFDVNEGLLNMKKRGLLRPSYEHMLRFLRQHGMGAALPSDKPFVLFLHEPLEDSQGGKVLYAGLFSSCRKAYLGHPDRGFSKMCLLAGVMPPK